MAYRKKAEFILKLKPDLLIVPECEHPDKLLFKKGTRQPTDLLWYGTNENKGLGIFSYCDLRLTLLKSHNPGIQTILPVKATNLSTQLTIIATWANNPTDPDGQYAEQNWKALSYYNSLIKKSDTILIGDFNSNTIWDRKRRIANHSNLVKKLEEKGIQSAYHFFYGMEQGKEKHPTLYLYRHKGRPYHIDYCFLSDDLLKKIDSVHIGRHKYWSQFSDHVPLTVTINDN